MVLVISLWLIIIMSVFGLGLARVSYSNYRFAKFKAGKFVTPYAIDEVLAICKFNRISDETPGYDTLSEFAQEEEYSFGNVRVVYSLKDEERKININKASSSILKGLPEISTDKAIDIVSSTLKPFRIREALLLMDEIEEEDYLSIKDFITVHGEGRININTCSEETMELLGMEDDLIERILNFRKGDDGEPDTGDDGAFESNTGIINTLREDSYFALTGEQTLVSLITKNMLGVKSDNYELAADVYVDNKLVDRYTIILGKRKGHKGYRIKEWYRE